MTIVEQSMVKFILIIFSCSILPVQARSGRRPRASRENHNSPGNNYNNSYHNVMVEVKIIGNSLGYGSRKIDNPKNCKRGGAKKVGEVVGGRNRPLAASAAPRPCKRFALESFTWALRPPAAIGADIAG